MNVKHIDAPIVGKRGKPDSGAAIGRHQCQLVRELGAECFLVVSGGSPSLLLRFAVIVGGQFLDRRAKNLGEQRHVGRQHWTHRQLRQRAGIHRAISQVVPSFVSFTATPILASSSRRRSDSFQSFRARPAARSAINALISTSFTPPRWRFIISCSLVSNSKPKNPHVAFSSHAVRQPPVLASSASLCNSIIS